MMRGEFGSSVDSATSEPAIKYPIKRVEPAIRKFITILQIDIDRLQKHRTNIERVKILIPISFSILF